MSAYSCRVLIYLRAPEFHLDTAFKICFKLRSETHREDKMSLRKYYKKSRGSYLFIFNLSRGENPCFLSHKGHHKAGNTVFEYNFFSTIVCINRALVLKSLLGDSRLPSIKMQVCIVSERNAWCLSSSFGNAIFHLPPPVESLTFTSCLFSSNTLHFPSPQLSSLGIIGNNLTSRP